VRGVAGVQEKEEGVTGVQELQELQNKKTELCPVLIFSDRGVFREVRRSSALIEPFCNSCNSFP